MSQTIKVVFNGSSNRFRDNQRHQNQVIKLSINFHPSLLPIICIHQRTRPLATTTKKEFAKAQILFCQFVLQSISKLVAWQFSIFTWPYQITNANLIRARSLPESWLVIPIFFCVWIRQTFHFLVFTIHFFDRFAAIPSFAVYPAQFCHLNHGLISIPNLLYQMWYFTLFGLLYWYY